MDSCEAPDLGGDWGGKQDSRDRRASLPFDRPAAAFVEHEPVAGKGTTTVATLFLVNRECPFECVYCDLWRHTTPESGPPGSIPGQIRRGLADLPSAREIKLYNSGNFFDPRAIPLADHPAIARLCAGFERVIVENHPRLCGERCGEFLARLQGESRQLERSPQEIRLEVALGLETVDPRSWPRLNKQMTPDDFREAARRLRGEGIDVRAFVMLQPPFVPPADAVASAIETVEFAWDSGARLVAVIPTRATTRTVRQWQAAGTFAEPRIGQLEQLLEVLLPRARGLLTVDTWDLERFCDCTACRGSRQARLQAINLAQRLLPGVACAQCGC
ncbi:MAG: radical SAM protein [Planctomycetaceae bacterium]